MYELRLFSRTLLFAGVLAGIGLASTQLPAQDGAPPAVARLAYLNNGNISFQPNGEDSWGQAGNNMPVDPGDRLVADQTGRGEIETGLVRAYFGNAADVTLVSLDQNGMQFGVAQGTVRFAVDGFPPDQALSIDTPNGAITVTQRAEVRVDVYPDQTIVTTGPYNPVYLNGGGGFQMTLGPRQGVQLSGTNPVYAQPVDIGPLDDFGHWAGAVESHRYSTIAARYVSTEMAGYDQLDNAGDWQPESDYGPIWFPRVQPGWAPYRDGHWVNRPFYGWTWVADEPWGIAPFHYGRWVQMQGRWGWIPGPREDHPIWSPAQVVFAGGIQIGGVGVSAWFPLGPGEPYHPWYPASPQYINQINITNIRESKVVHVQNTYVNVTNVTNITYVNKTVGVTAMKQEDFAAGHSAQVAAIKVAPQQIEHVQVAAPTARPPAQRVIVHPIVKPAAIPAARPVLINSKGQEAPATPNARPVPVPVKAAPPAPRPVPGHAPVGAPMMGNKPAPAAPPMKAEPAAPQPAKPEPVLKPTPAPVAPPARTPPAAPARTPAEPPTKAVPPAAEKPMEPKEPMPQPKPAPRPMPPAAVKPQPIVPEVRPAQPKPGEARPNLPVPPANAKDAKKAADEKKKEDKKPEKPE